MSRKKKWSIEKIDVDQDEIDLVTNLIVNDEFAKAVAPAIDISLFELDFARQVLKWVTGYHKKFGKAPKQTIQKIFDQAVNKDDLDEATADQIEGYLENLSDRWEKEDVDVPYEIKKALVYLSGLHIKKHTSRAREYSNREKPKKLNYYVKILRIL